MVQKRKFGGTVKNVNITLKHQLIIELAKDQGVQLVQEQLLRIKIDCQYYSRP